MIAQKGRKVKIGGREVEYNKAREVLFEKWQACGNDFIVIENGNGCFDEEKLCDRHYGIGADGVLYIEEPRTSQAQKRMIVKNADGSEAEMCGNGIRCVAQYMYDHYDYYNCVIETGAGLKIVNVEEPYMNIEVEMGIAKVKWEREIEVPIGTGEEVKRFKASYVDMGNPHCVIIAKEEDLKRGGVERYGRKIEKLRKVFPYGANVEFVLVKSDGLIEVKVWERGVGRTLACGTGACASAYAAYQRGLVVSDVTVRLEGGEVTVGMDEEGHIVLTGPAERVYRGAIRDD